MEEQNNNGQLQIELKEEVAQGTYANLAIITHSSSEFILFTIIHQMVYELRNLLVIKHGIRKDNAFFWFCFSHLFEK